MTVPDPEFKPKEKVYHVTPDSPQGIVLDAKYSMLTNSWEYLVAFGTGLSISYYEHELSKTKNFV